jgi:DNA-binding MarR family transcriptional regulator
MFNPVKIIGPTMNPNNPELQLLDSLYTAMEEGDNSTLNSQRALACTSGLSLGLTNALLKRFIDRGWVKLLHVRGSVIKYALTPSGVQQIAVRTVDFFARAMRNASLYRKKIDIFIEKVARRGYDAVLFLGPEELDFLFDYACLRHGLQFYKKAEPCLRVINAGRMEYENLVVICANDDAGEEVRSRAGMPRSVPLIRFSQILLNSAVEKLKG